MVRRRMRVPVSEKIMMIIFYVIILFFVFVTLYPFIHILALSLSSPEEAIKPGMHIIPKGFNFTSYKKVFSMPLLFSSYMNTLFVVVVGTLSNMVFTILAAYPLSRKRLIFRSTFTLLIVFTMMFSGGLIPSYLLMRAMGLVNNRWVLVISGLVSAYNMVIMKNFFQAIPESLEESAKIDGAGDFRILTNIILPLSMPVLATIGLFYAVGHWNAFFTCMIYITDQTKIVLQVLLRQLIVTSEMQFSSDMIPIEDMVTNTLPMQDKSTIIIVATLPILMIYPFLQRFFVKGVMIGAVKG